MELRRDSSWPVNVSGFPLLALCGAGLPVRGIVTMSYYSVRITMMYIPPSQPEH